VHAYLCSTSPGCREVEVYVLWGKGGFRVGSLIARALLHPFSVERLLETVRDVIRLPSANPSGLFVCRFGQSLSGLPLASSSTMRSQNIPPFDYQLIFALVSHHHFDAWIHV
jgi:hypothetical protein